MAKLPDASHAEEKADVEVLYAQSAKMSETSKKIQALRSRLVEGGDSLREALGPVHKNTRDDQTIMRNIDLIDAHIDKMLEPGKDRAKEEEVIRAGIARVGLPTYMDSVKRIDRALMQMTATNLRANQQSIGDYNDLLYTGLRNLEEWFRSTLSESCKPIEAAYFITKGIAFPALSQETASELRTIDRILSSPSARNTNNSQRESSSVRIYSDCRSAYLVGSLQSLSISSISSSKRKNKDEPYQQGSSVIRFYASGIRGLFLAELDNVTKVFPREDCGMAMDVTTRKALADLAKTLRELNMYIKQNLVTDCFLAYEVIENMTRAAHEVNSALGAVTADVKLPFAEALKPIRETAKASLTELLEDQRRRISELQILPANGSTLSFTIETMKRLQNLNDNRSSLASILTSLAAGTCSHPSPTPQPTKPSSSLPSLKSLDVGADGSQLLSHYITDTLDIHISQLESRARTLLKSKATHGVLLSNTLATIDKMIRTSDLDSLLSSSPTAQSKLESWRKKATTIYLDSWRETSYALLDVQHTNRSGPRPHSGSAIASAEVIKSLSSKDKDAIKEKWKLFNSSFDECVKRHREMTGGMEREVKSNLSREVGNQIEPLYTRFWDRYEALDRGRGKYVKYDKGQLSAILASLG